MAFLSPDHLVDHLHLPPHATVADIGAGSGAYTIALARKVGDEGKVYAIDVHREALDTLQSSLQKAGFMNTDIIWCDIERGAYLDSYTLDAVVLSNVLFTLDDIPAALHEVGRLLVPGGEVLVVDWRGSFGGIGPHEDHIVTQEKAEEEFHTQGFTILRHLPAGTYHYAFIATKK